MNAAKNKPTPVAPATSPEPVLPAETTSTRILKISTCPSLSGQSTLTYHIGCTAESDILFRITGNTGAGVFGNEWIALSGIQQVFDAVPPGKLIRSALLVPLFNTRSINTPAFMLAALMNEGLVSVTENQGYYLRADPGKFMAEVAAWVDAGVDLNVGDKLPEPVTRKKSKKESADFRKGEADFSKGEADSKKGQADAVPA